MNINSNGSGNDSWLQQKAALKCSVTIRADIFPDRMPTLMCKNERE